MTDQSNTTVSELLAEVERLRPHYQSGTATDAGRRQMLDHFAEFAGKLSARRATAEVTEAMVERAAKATFEEGSVVSWEVAADLARTDPASAYGSVMGSFRRAARTALLGALSQQAPE